MVAGANVIAGDPRLGPLAGLAGTAVKTGGFPSVYINGKPVFIPGETEPSEGCVSLAEVLAEAKVPPEILAPILQTLKARLLPLRNNQGQIILEKEGLVNLVKGIRDDVMRRTGMLSSQKSINKFAAPISSKEGAKNIASKEVIPSIYAGPAQGLNSQEGSEKTNPAKGLNGRPEASEPASVLLALGQAKYLLSKILDDNGNSYLKEI